MTTAQRDPVPASDGWARSRERMAAHLRTDGPAGPHVQVRVLGLEDVLSRSGAPPAPDGEVLPVNLQGDAVLVGPVSSPDGPGPCPLCLARRWQQVRPNEYRDVLERGSTVHAVGEPPLLTGFALDALRELVAHVAGTPAADRPVGRAGHPYVHELRLDSLRVRRHPVVADSQCPDCARPVPDTAERARVEPASRPKPSVDTFRVSAVADYPLDLSAYVNPVCGVAGAAVHPRMSSTTTANAMGRVAVAGGDHLHDMYWGGHSDSYARSALLGLMEAHERLAGTQPRRVTGLLVDTYRNVADHAVDPAECGLYADDAASELVRWSADLPIPWVWGWSLRDERAVLVPALLTYYHLADQSAKFVQECSNGCASGGCLEEAVLHGLLELVERDAFLISWYARPDLTEIDPRTSARPATRHMVERLSMYGYDVRLFDSRIEFPVPVVTAVAHRRDGGPGTALFCAGASPDPEEAIASGLYEVAGQVPDFARETAALAGLLRAKAADFDRVRTLTDHPMLYGLPEMARHAEHLLARRRPALPVAEVYREWNAVRPRTLDLRDDLRHCVAAVTAAGFDVVVVDQTSPEQLAIGLRTASVLAPGLLPIDFGWRRQRALSAERTRTVLRRTGRLDRDLAPGELNLAPHPFP